MLMSVQDLVDLIHGLKSLNLSDYAIISILVYVGVLRPLAKRLNGLSVYIRKALALYRRDIAMKKQISSSLTSLSESILVLHKILACDVDEKAPLSGHVFDYQDT